MAIITLPLEWDSQRWPNFTFDEMKCQETGEMGCDSDMLDMLQEMRNKRGRGIGIASGFRSARHSIESAKRKPGSHTQGIAIDPRVSSGRDIYELVSLAIAVGFTGIGIGRREAICKMHLDCADWSQRPTIWTY